MTIEKTHSKFRSMLWGMSVVFVGAAIGGVVASQWSPAAILGGGFAELHARLWLFENFQRPILGLPPPDPLQQIVTIFSTPAAFEIGTREMSTWLWHCGIGAGAGALTALVLATLIATLVARPSLLLNFFKSGSAKNDE